MFNPLTRTLKLGLTAITILTAGGFAFAPTAAEARATSTQIANCKSYPFGWSSTRYGSGGCGVTLRLNSDQLNAAKVRHCHAGTNYNKYVCRNIVNRATAANWAKKNPTISTRIVPSRNNQLLRGSATGLDSIGVVVSGHSRLRMTDGTFNGRALGGIVENGIASFVALHSSTVHAGILSGTDLGAPIRSPAGTKSRWVGRIQSGGLGMNRDFVLEVTFGTDRDGSVEAFVPYTNSNPRYGNGHLRLRGRFDDTGVIEGTVTANKYNNNDRNNLRTHIIDSVNPTPGRGNGDFTGLIGEKGAVGAFISTGGYYVGGFVARPAEDVEGIAVYLKELCESNRAHEFCFVSDIDADTIVRNCIRNPFGTTTTEYGSGGCARTLGASRHRTEKANRIPFCNIAGNVRSDRCTHPEVLTAICNNNLFGAGCLNSRSYDPNRASVIASCNTVNGRYASACRTSSAITAICNNNLFGVGCLTHSRYNPNRASVIASCNTVNGRYASACRTSSAITAICNNNLFGVGCLTHSRYNPNRASVIASCNTVNGRYASACRTSSAITAICNNNLFGVGCLTHSRYNPNRASVIASCNTVNGRYASACRTSSAITAICNNNLFGVGCLTHSRYNPNRASVIASCNTVNGRYASACRTSSAITAICNNNLFGVGCLTHSRYNPNRASVIASCNTVNGRYASACRTSSAITAICNNNLFGVGCLTHSRYNPNRASVITSCNAEGGKNASACRTPDAVTAICADNLFGVGCLTHSSYADARTTSLDVCNIANNSGNSLCRDRKLDNICSYAPFAALCLNRLDLESEEVVAKFTTCRAANSSDLTCHGVNPELKPSERKPNTATWVDSFVTKSSPSGPPSVADTTTMRSQFLQGGETDLDQAAIPRVREPDELYLNADNFDDSLELLTSVVPTDTTDGVAFAFGINSANQRKFYAGILSGTDLGEPIAGISETKAVWEGTFQSVWVATKTKFDLEITFGNDKTGSIEAFIERKTSDKFYSIVPHFYLEGTFDSNGLITGKVITARFANKTPVEGYNYRYTGILRGLIGEEGAVGAFVGGTSTDKGNTITGTSVFSGGFVARVSTVDYADWEGEATPLDAIPATTGNQFLSGELLGRTRTSTKLNLRHATYNGYLLNGDSRDGVAFFKSQPTTGQASYYAGIFSGTDLGAPVTQTGKSAYWSGRFQVVDNDAIAPSVGFVLRVNFDKVGDKAGSISSLVKNAVGTTPVALEGRFDYKGVITGTARLNGSLGTTSGSMATMKGLIGQDGAVGVFIADDGQTPFSGGFVARPHSVNIKDLRNYATLQTSPSGLVDSGGFLRGIPSLNGQLDDNRGHFPSTDFYPIRNSNTIGRRDGDNDDGYHYFGIIDDDEDSRYYAGILTTTNLGAPLVTPIGNAPTSAIWQGHASFGVVASAKNVPTKFYLNFAAGTIEFANDAENGADTATVGVSTSNLTGVQLTLNGKFGVGDSSLSLGQLGGDMRASSIDRGETPLPVTGLIGQDGVVGVFVHPLGTSSGGFVGQPPQ